MTLDPRTQTEIPLNVRYERVARILELDKPDHKVSAKLRRHRMELIGPQVITSAPSVWWQVSIVLNAGFNPLDWGLMKVRERAKIRAAYAVKSMVDLLSRNDEINQRKLEKLSNS